MWMFIDDNGIISSLTKSSSAADDGTSTSAVSWLMPGFFDMHNHGYGGTEDMGDYWMSDFTLKRLPSFATTSALASISFPLGQEERTRELVRTIEKRVQFSLNSATIDTELKVANDGLAMIHGVHAEGPVVATRGGLPEQNNQPTLTEFEQLIDSIPSLKVMTIAPSLEAKFETTPFARLRALLRRNILPALGHDVDCTEQQIIDALNVGNEYQKNLHITHLCKSYGCRFYY
jgi:N-acetylglucosamine-6-phosphate deacetylase